MNDQKLKEINTINHSLYEKLLLHCDDNDNLVSILNLLKQNDKPVSKENIIHSNCSRYYLYFTTRYIIIYDYNTKMQKIYNGHKNNVSEIIMHPTSKIIVINL